MNSIFLVPLALALIAIARAILSTKTTTTLQPINGGIKMKRITWILIALATFAIAVSLFAVKAPAQTPLSACTTAQY
jgi:hypothetical protein